MFLLLVFCGPFVWSVFMATFFATRFNFVGLFLAWEEVYAVGFCGYVPPDFSSFHCGLLLTFLVTAVMPLVSLAFVDCRVSCGVTESRVVSSTMVASGRLISRLGSHLNRIRGMTSAVRFRVCSLGRPSSGGMSTLGGFATIGGGVSLCGSAFSFFRVCIFLRPSRLNSGRDLCFFSASRLSTCNLSGGVISNSNFSSI